MRSFQHTRAAGRTLLALLALLALAGCGAGAVNPPAPLASITPAPSATRAHGWREISWHGLLIALPAGADWRQGSFTSQRISGVSMVAAAAVGYPQAFAPLEHPAGPIFVIYSFSGSLDEWLRHEHEVTPMNRPLEEQARDLTIAGMPAKGYQPARQPDRPVEFYALKIDADRLLKITIRNTDYKLYTFIVEQLRLLG